MGYSKASQPSLFSLVTSWPHMILQTTPSPDLCPSLSALSSLSMANQRSPTELRSTREASRAALENGDPMAANGPALCHHHSHEEAQGRRCSVLAPVLEFAPCPLPLPHPNPDKQYIHASREELKQGDP